MMLQRVRPEGGGLEGGVCADCEICEENCIFALVCICLVSFSVLLRIAQAILRTWADLPTLATWK